MQQRENYFTGGHEEDLRLLVELADRLLDDDEEQTDLEGFSDDENEDDADADIAEFEAIIGRLISAIDFMSLQMVTNKNEVVEMAHDRSQKPSFSRDGRMPYGCTEEKPRAYRSFASDREKQVLRHIATQCYFYLKGKRVENLVEIQVMHLSWQGRNNLFIVANQFSVTEKFSSLISRTNFRQILAKAFTTRNVEGTLRSNRYASKIQKRIFGNSLAITGDNSKDVENAKAIGTILHANNLYLLPINYIRNALSNNSKDLIENGISSTGNVFFVSITGHSNKQRHAEEFLCDIAEYVKSREQEIKNRSSISNESAIPMHTAIAGKKRPCIGCSGRMRTLISNYGQFPGKFWSHTIKDQPQNAQIETLKLLHEASAHTSVYKDGRTLDNDYDSGSESEEEYQDLNLSCSY